MDEADGDPRRPGRGVARAGREARGGGGERAGLGVPALPDVEAAAKSRRGRTARSGAAASSASRSPRAAWSGGDQGAGVVGGVDQLGRAAGGGRDERNAGLQAVGDGDRRVVKQRGDDGEPAGLRRQVGDRLGGPAVRERLHRAGPAARALDERRRVEAVDRLAEERDARRGSPLARQPRDGGGEQHQPLARLQPAEEDHLAERRAVARRAGGRGGRVGVGAGKTLGQTNARAGSS